MPSLSAAEPNHRSAQAHHKPQSGGTESNHRAAKSPHKRAPNEPKLPKKAVRHGTAAKPKLQLKKPARRVRPPKAVALKQPRRDVPVQPHALRHGGVVTAANLNPAARLYAPPVHKSSPANSAASTGESVDTLAVAGEPATRTPTSPAVPVVNSPSKPVEPAAPGAPVLPKSGPVIDPATE